jgi:hypothetical protein
MARSKRRAVNLLMFMVATAAIGSGASQARAQYGMGMGYGGMFMGFNPVPSPGNYLNQHALTRAAAGSREPSRTVYANNPNAYINKIRDNGFSSHYSPDSRRPTEYATARRARNARLTSNNQPAPATDSVAATKPVVPIGNFFNEARKLVWPSDAPLSGELGGKRDTSDQASLVVKELVDQHGAAPITTVTDARQKLLDYGQPALQLIRSITTPLIAENFHMFMLSLYESLAAAASPADSTATANPTR